jgi:hypothetical protein
MSLGEDLARVWDGTAATPETRKKIIRTVISEIVVDVINDSVEMVIHWEGGDHTKIAVTRPAVWTSRIRRSPQPGRPSLQRAATHQGDFRHRFQSSFQPS